MKLIKDKTPIERNRDTVDQILLQSAEALNHAAAVMTQCHNRFWSLPTAGLLELMNDDVERTLAVFHFNTTIANTINAALDAIDPERASLYHRAPVAAQRVDIAFDGKQFALQEPGSDPEPPKDPEPPSNL